MVHCKLVMTKIRTSSLSIEASELVSRCGGMAKPKQIEPKYNDTDVWAYGTTSKHVVEEHGKHVVESRLLRHVGTILATIFTSLLPPLRGGPMIVDCTSSMA